MDDALVPVVIGMFSAEPSDEAEGWDGYFFDLSQIAEAPTEGPVALPDGELLSRNEPTRVRAIAEAFATMMERSIADDPSLAWFPDFGTIRKFLKARSEE